MRRFLLCLAPISACGSLSAASANAPRTALAQGAWTDSGAFINEEISLEWGRISSSEPDSFCILSMNLNGDGNFIRFAFRERPVFVRIFCTENKMVFSHKKETTEINPRERVFSETEKIRDEEDAENGSPLRVVKISLPENGCAVSPERLNEAVNFDFGEFSAYAEIPDAFLQMFEEYPLLYSEEESRTSAFFMPKPRELAIAVDSRKGAKGVTIYFSPPGQKDFFLWRIALVNGKPVVVEYASRENLFWMDEDGDGIPDFCVKKQHGNWLRFECLKETASADERTN